MRTFWPLRLVRASTVVPAIDSEAARRFGCECAVPAWHVGRTVAECGECGAIVPMAHTGVVGMGRVTRGRHAGGRIR